MQQIKIRAERIGSFTDDLELFCETDLIRYCVGIDAKRNREVVVIDSIQTMYQRRVSIPHRAVFLRCVEATSMFYCNWQKVLELLFLLSVM